MSIPFQLRSQYELPIEPEGCVVEVNTLEPSDSVARFHIAVLLRRIRTEVR
jgi:hypothetical protein